MHKINELGKKGVGWEFIVKLILGLIIMGIIFYFIFRSSGVMEDWIDKIKDWF